MQDKAEHHGRMTDLVERLMGRDPAPRFEFIQNSAAAVDEGALRSFDYARIRISSPPPRTEVLGNKFLECVGGFDC